MYITVSILLGARTPCPSPLRLLCVCWDLFWSGGLPLPLLLAWLPIAVTSHMYNVFSILVDLLLLGGDPCRSFGDQPPVLAPRGDPTRLGDLSVDPPLVVLLYSVSVTPLLRVILYLSGTQGGAGSPPPLVEVNHAILAWSF